MRFRVNTIENTGLVYTQSKNFFRQALFSFFDVR